MRDISLFLGLVILVLFGSALDSEGLAGWAAVGGVLAGLVLLFIGGKEASGRGQSR